MSSDKKQGLGLYDNERYRGHPSLCEIDLPGQRAIAEASVGVVGAGGLGSPVVLYLAAAGVGRITVVDDDCVELSNLQRQIMHGTPDIGLKKVESARKAVMRINPEVEIVAVDSRLSYDNGEVLLGGCDVVADCTDSFTSRLMVSRICARLGKPMCFGSVGRFSGQLFTQMPGSACFADIFGETPYEETDCSCSATGVLNTMVGVVGSLQATEVLKIIAGTGDLLTNRLLMIDALTMTFQTVDVGCD